MVDPQPPQTLREGRQRGMFGFLRNTDAEKTPVFRDDAQFNRSRLGAEIARVCGRAAPAPGARFPGEYWSSGCCVPLESCGYESGF